VNSVTGSSPKKTSPALVAKNSRPENTYSSIAQYTNTNGIYYAKYPHTYGSPPILGTKKGIAALIDFLKDTTAFTSNNQLPKKPPLPLFLDEPEANDDPEPANDAEDALP
jgi:hypothetical protein